MSADLIIHPDTGEIFDQLEQFTPDVLAELAHALQTREKECKHWRATVELELIGRLRAENRERATVGNYEIAYKASRQSVWDVDDTRTALDELKDRGWINAVETVGIIHTPDPEVRRSAANSLLDRLHGPARELLARCRTWTSGTPRFSVTENVQLLDEEATR